MNASCQDNAAGSTARRDSQLVIALLVLFLVGNAGLVSAIHEVGERLWNNGFSQSFIFLYEVIIGTFVGFFFAQVALHSIWTVFANCRVIRRIAVSVGAAGLLALSVMATQLYVEWDDTTQNHWGNLSLMMLHLPVILIGIQSPLWILKAGLGWSVTGPGTVAATRKRHPLSIGGMMLGTAVAAFCLTCIRLASSVAHAPLASLALSMLGTTAVLSTVASLAMVPSLIVTLKARRVRRAVAVVIAIQVATLLALIAILSMIYGPPPRETVWMFGMVLVSFVVTLLKPLLVARRLGYRLHTHRTRLAGSANPFRDEPVSSRSDEERGSATS